MRALTDRSQYPSAGMYTVCSAVRQTAAYKAGLTDAQTPETEETRIQIPVHAGPDQSPSRDLTRHESYKPGKLPPSAVIG
jgi:hypothetical protein